MAFRQLQDQMLRHADRELADILAPEAPLLL
jgi:hypothetical protein